MTQLADTEAQLDGIVSASGGHLRLASFPGAGHDRAPRDRRFRERHPKVEVTLIACVPDEGIDCLKEGGDIALTLEAGLIESPTRQSSVIRCLTTRCLAACRTIIRVRAGSIVPLNEPAEEAWIIGAIGTCPDGLILQHSCRRPALSRA